MKFNKIGIVIGTQKGGTTSLFHYLSQHPQVAESKVKETDFFVKDDRWSKGIDHYESLYEWDAEKHVTAFEASPNYTFSVENARKVIQRMKTVDVSYKFIYVLRDPIQKIESMRKHGTYKGWYAPHLKQETPDTLPPTAIESVKYAEILDIFVDSFSKAQVLLLKTDDLRSEHISSTLSDRICPFLEIDPSFNFSTEKTYNTQNSYRNDTIWHALRESNYLNPIKNVFPEVIKNRARNLLAKPPKKDKVPALTDGQKAFIRAALRDDSLRLKNKYSLDMSNWDMNA
ncbi:MAG: sulfotransferase domain-containing protein [Cyanobacteria bacterium J06627_32]